MCAGDTLERISSRSIVFSRAHALRGPRTNPARPFGSRLNEIEPLVIFCLIHRPRFLRLSQCNFSPPASIVQSVAKVCPTGRRHNGVFDGDVALGGSSSCRPLFAALSAEPHWRRPLLDRTRPCFVPLAHPVCRRRRQRPGGSNRPQRYFRRRNFLLRCQPIGCPGCAHGTSRPRRLF